VSKRLLTRAEQSNFRQTGRTDEVERLAEAYARAWPDAARSFEYGRSCEGRPMRAQIVSRTGVLSARELKRRRIPNLMIQGGIHPGESDGKDAGFIALRELLEGGGSPEIANLLDPLEQKQGSRAARRAPDGHRPAPVA
jgi:hypothetical protein